MLTGEMMEYVCEDVNYALEDAELTYSLSAIIEIATNTIESSIYRQELKILDMRKNGIEGIEEKELELEHYKKDSDRFLHELKTDPAFFNQFQGIWFSHLNNQNLTP